MSVQNSRLGEGTSMAKGSQPGPVQICLPSPKVHRLLLSQAEHVRKIMLIAMSWSGVREHAK